MVALNATGITLWPEAASADIARYNLLVWSEDFSQSAWASNGTMTTATSTLTASGALNSEARQVVTRSTNGETVTFSVEVKNNTGSAEWDILIAEYNGTTFLSGTNVTLTGLSGSFQRFSASHAGSEATGDRWRVRIRRTNASGAADGDQVGVQNAQLEVASSFTSYQRVNDGTEFS